MTALMSLPMRSKPSLRRSWVITLKCARCHDHKYDPLPQRDYYRFKAIFQGAYDEHDWVAPLRSRNTAYISPVDISLTSLPAHTRSNFRRRTASRTGQQRNRDTRLRNENRPREEDRRAEENDHRAETTNRNPRICKRTSGLWPLRRQRSGTKYRSTWPRSSRPC